MVLLLGTHGTPVRGMVHMVLLLGSHVAPALCLGIEAQLGVCLTQAFHHRQVSFRVGRGLGFWTRCLD